MSQEELRTFWDKCDRHDWHFPFSDDRRVYAAELKAHEALKTEARTDADKQDIFDAFRLHVSTGKPYGTEQQPKPERP